MAVHPQQLYGRRRIMAPRTSQFRRRRRAILDIRSGDGTQYWYSAPPRLLGNPIEDYPSLSEEEIESEWDPSRSGSWLFRIEPDLLQERGRRRFRRRFPNAPGTRVPIRGSIRYDPHLH